MPKTECRPSHRDSRGAAQLRKNRHGGKRLWVLNGRSEKLPDEPISIGTNLPSSPTYQATPSCPLAALSPPRGASITNARRSPSASLSASQERASSCSHSLRGAPVWIVPYGGPGTSCYPGSSRGSGLGVLIAPPGPSLCPTPLLHSICLYFV
jgi:hypothetical protein